MRWMCWGRQSHMDEARSQSRFVWRQTRAIHEPDIRVLPKQAIVTQPPRERAGCADPRESGDAQSETGKGGERRFGALGFVGAAFTLGVIVIADHSIGRWLWAALSIGVLATGIFRFRKEKALLTEWATAVATVTAWERTEGNEGGYYYSVRYRFIGPDNRAYVGKSGSTAEELPREGEMLPISYKRSDPTDSLPLMTFWFYGFTYTGFARWI